MVVVDIPNVLGVVGQSRLSIFVYRIFGLGAISYRGRYMEKTTILLRVLLALSWLASYLYILHTNGAKLSLFVLIDGYEVLIFFRIIIHTTMLLCVGLFTNYYTKQLASYVEDIRAVDRKFAKFKIYKKRGFFYLIEIIGMLMLGCKWIVDIAIEDFLTKFSFIQFCAYIIITYGKMSIVMYNMVSIDLIYWISQRLKLINEICSDVNDLTCSLNEQDDVIRMLAEQHYAILDIAKRTTKLFEFTFIMNIVLTYVTLITNVIMLYKYLSIGDIRRILTFFGVAREFSYFNVIGIIAICYICDQAVTQANQTKMILHKTTFNKSYVYLIPNLTMFMTYLTDEILSFEPYQFFDIDNGLIVTMLTNVLAFTTILIQYQ